MCSGQRNIPHEHIIAAQRSIEIPYEYVIAAKKSRELIHMFEAMDATDQSQQILCNSDMAQSYNKAKLYLKHYQREYYDADK